MTFSAEDASNALDPSGTAALVSLSASYGAGGSVVAPALAERLRMSLLGRLISPDVAQSGCDECLTHEEAKGTPIHRLFLHLSHAAPAGASVAPSGIRDHDRQIRRESETAIAELVRRGGGVILGRAAAVVLAGRPLAYHLRLDGPPARRAVRGAEIEGISLSEAEARMIATDKARTAYVRRLYRVDPRDPRLYHLVVDTTSLSLSDVVQLLATATLAFWGEQRQAHASR